MKPVHCIGDSHVDFFKSLPFFRIHYVGPALAFNLCVCGTTTKGREKALEFLEKIPKGSRLLLCFGEIDCRCHILKYSHKKNFVENCVNRYFQFIEELKDYEVFIWGVVPSARDSVPIDAAYPRLGTCEERNTITRKFNEKLKALCGKKFISIFDELVDEKGLTRQEYFDDRIHLSHETMPLAIRELRKHFKDMPALKRRKLHIGGEQEKSGWEIFNIKEGYAHEGNAKNLSRFPDETFSEIYASHILEHFDYMNSLRAALKEWHRVLKKGGKIYISVPDLDALCRLWASNPPLKHKVHLMRIIFGGHMENTDYHFTGLNYEILECFLKGAGFEAITKVDTFGLFGDCSELKIANVPISVNITARKGNDLARSN